MTRVTHIMLRVLGVLGYTCLMAQIVSPLTIQEVLVSGKPEFDVVDTVKGEGGSYDRRIISHGGWRFVVVERNTLVSLQRTAPFADSATLNDAVLRSGLVCLRVGCKTAKAMGVSQWTCIEMINESHYKAILSVVTAVETGNVLVAPFKAALAELEKHVQDAL